MQKTCSPDVATESSLASFKIPEILYSDGIWQIASHPAAAYACQQCLRVVSSNLNKLFDDSPPLSTYRE